MSPEEQGKADVIKELEEGRQKRIAAIDAKIETALAFYRSLDLSDPFAQYVLRCGKTYCTFTPNPESDEAPDDTDLNVQDIAKATIVDAAYAVKIASQMSGKTDSGEVFEVHGWPAAFCALHWLDILYHDRQRLRDIDTSVIETHGVLTALPDLLRQLAEVLSSKRH